ncbi:MAG: nucleotidyltransferase domain-containing protein [Actinomycetaceae bacterium]|nr:nucleotidyltransferase domain-containing protein [Actinomycetaceae bacterium]
MRRRPSDSLDEYRNEVYRCIINRGFHSPQIFGSVARGEDTTESDLDLLVTPGKGVTIFDLSGLTLDFEELLGIHVDVISTGAPISRVVHEGAIAL